MNLQIYRIDRSMSGRVGNWLRPPSLPVLAQSGICLGNPFKVFRNLMDGIQILHSNDEVSRFRDPRGMPLVDDVYYIRHPKHIRTDCLLPAADFHTFIVREQLADLVSYIRANTEVKKLNVAISSSGSGNAGLKSALEGIPLEANASLKMTKSHEVVINCELPLKPPQKRKEYVWLEDFATTMAAVDAMSGGKLEISERFDLSFGLDANLVETLNVSAEWLHTYRYQLVCEFS